MPDLMWNDELHLRRLTLHDAKDMQNVLADPSLYRYIGGGPPNREELYNRYRRQTRGMSSDGRERWVNSLVILGIQPIGYVQATIHVDTDIAEIAWVIGHRWQHHGYAKQAARLLVDDLASQGITTVIAYIHPDHLASQQVAVSLGLVATRDVVDGEVRWAGSTDRS